MPAVAGNNAAGANAVQEAGANATDDGGSGALRALDVSSVSVLHYSELSAGIQWLWAVVLGNPRESSFCPETTMRAERLLPLK